ncbi:glycosyltransferase family 2 protein [Arundinibacter roseus]|uniref:Glycosyltransferase n=1 Tax=Arundinibacter roseus TaxID=2070510 RepID=A0A4R4KDA9_9BACT|nr:glycosyltransferase family 2 protein [Arundinibacter roseus]TDB64491.1 glycosyltransferase [Arundinibacter roseus]
MKSLEQYTSDLRKSLLKSPKKAMMDPSFPRLTVITPSYNQGIYLERTILSVLNQGYPNLEYIIIDGGSTDSSVEVIKKYENYLSYWVSEKDNGQVHALNKGLSRATGEWLSFQNSDDVYFPETFSRFGAVINKYPNVSIFYGDLFMITPDDTVTELLKTLPFNFKSQYFEGMQIHNQSLFFKKKLVEKFGLFDESYRFAFDYEFITRFTAQPGTYTKRIEGLAGALRVHEDAKSSTIAEVGKQEHARVQADFRKYISGGLPHKLQYLYCRIRKIAYLVAQMDWKYIAHRKSLQQK